MKSSLPFIERYLKKLSGWFVLLLLLFVGALALFGYLIDEVLLEEEQKIDEETFVFLSKNVITPQLTSIMKAITNLAASLFLQIGYAVLVFLYLIRKNWKRSIEIAAIGLGGYAINYFMKLFFQRPRPDNPLIDALHNFSFPSGHATSGFIFYGLLIYLLFKSQLSKVYTYLLSAILAVLILVIGFSRIYLRVHYLSDVLAGFCIGLAWLAMSIYLMERLKKQSSKGRRGNDG